VLEGVTLAEVIQFMVEVLVNLAAGTILDEETTEDTQTAHPDDLAISISEYVQCLLRPKDFSIPWHTSIRSTLPLTKTTMPTNSSRSSEFPCARSRVHGNGLSDDEAICNELSDGLTRVGVGDFAGLIGIQPDLALSAANDGCRQALLSGEVDPVKRIDQYLLDQ
jgi:hypothetical protein